MTTLALLMVSKWDVCKMCFFKSYPKHHNSYGKYQLMHAVNAIKFTVFGPAINVIPCISYDAKRKSLVFSSQLYLAPQDQLCEKWWSVTWSQWKKEHATYNKRMEANWIGHILRRNCLLKHVITEKIGGTKGRGRRRKQLVDCFQEMSRHWNLK